MSAGLLDTSVVIDWHDPAVAKSLPNQVAISAITAAKLTDAPHLAADPAEAAKRQARLQEVEAKLQPIPSTPPRYAATGSSSAPSQLRDDSRGHDSPTLLIAATAHANQLDL